MHKALANACDPRGLFSRFAEDQALLAMLSRLLPDMTLVPGDLHDDKYRDLFSVEDVNRQVVAGVPFRDAYKAVAKTIDDGTFEPDRTLRHVHDGSWGIEKQMRQSRGMLERRL